MNRIALAVGAGVLAAAAVTASASTLGGLRAGGLGADQAVVAACDSDGVDLTYTTTYDAPSGLTKVTEVKLAGMAAGCTGQKATVTLASAGAPLAEVSANVAGPALTIALPTPVDAAAVTKAALVIAG